MKFRVTQRLEWEAFQERLVWTRFTFGNKEYSLNELEPHNHDGPDKSRLWTVHTYSGIATDLYTFVFTQPDMAVLFKLRWGGE